MRRQFTADEITSATRRGPTVYAARDADGVWGYFAADRVCFIKEKADILVLMRWCNDAECERLEILERLGFIICVPMSTPYGVYGITKRITQ